jgi:hypothetical protein
MHVSSQAERIRRALRNHYLRSSIRATYQKIHVFGRPLYVFHHTKRIFLLRIMGVTTLYPIAIVCLSVTIF